MTTLGFSGKALDYQNVEIVQEEAFWPSLNLAEFQKQRKIPVAVEADTILQAILTAIGDINRRLADYVETKKTEGYAQASAVPGARVGVDGENQLTAQYKKAVYAQAKADLMAEFSSVARLGKTGQNNGGTTADDEQSAARNMLIAECSMTVRAILGMGRATVSLI